MNNAPQIVEELAEHIKAAVLPHLGTFESRQVSGIAHSGDATFNIDVVAEDAMESFLREREWNLAWYSEDRGLVRLYEDREPEGILIIDPIDGTRGAAAGFEACVVSVAWAEPVAEPRLRDVRCGAVTEIKGGRTFVAERGKGVKVTDASGAPLETFCLPTSTLVDMPWSVELIGAPLERLFEVLRFAANHSTVRGGMFVLNSSAYEMTRLVCGQLAAVVDVRYRLLRARPDLREDFTKFGGGRLLGLFGYDIAASTLIAEECGCIVTDAWGNSLADWKLLQTDEANFGSLIAASNESLHSALLEAINRGFSGR